MTPGPAKQFDQSQALQRAMELFWSQGFEATSLPDLTRVMGIGRQSLYNTFGDKKALFRDALLLYMEERAATAREILDRPGSPLGNLRDMILTFRERSRAQGHCGCFLGNSVAEFGAADPEIKEILDRYVNLLRGGIRRTLQAAQDAGEIAPDLDPEKLAAVLLTLFQGAALISKTRPDDDFLDGAFETAFALMRRTTP
ncbi:MAG: TetR/AcrR family transcriptional regulator [Gemmatimonadetes bacterium]|nr:TetR/AcrR family transcriptional regulator [Gemmatimonadota bacterium]